MFIKLPLWVYNVSLVEIPAAVFLIVSCKINWG